MRIRESTVPDAAAMARVSVDTWRTTYPGIVPQEYLARLSYARQEEHFARRLGNADADFVSFVALDASDTVIGFANGGPERAGDPDYRGEIYALYLRAEHQGQGIGRCLVRQMAQALAARNIPSLLVWVLAANPSRRFYESLGGQYLRTGPYPVGGVILESVAYGWKDTAVLCGD